MINLITIPNIKQHVKPHVLKSWDFLERRQKHLEAQLEPYTNSFDDSITINPMRKLTDYFPDKVLSLPREYLYMNCKVKIGMITFYWCDCVTTNRISDYIADKDVYSLRYMSYPLDWGKVINFKTTPTEMYFNSMYVLLDHTQ